MIIPGLFFLGLGVLFLLVSRAAGETSRLVAAAMAGRAELKDGQRVAVIGTIEPELPPMLSPGRSLPCVIYSYQVEDPAGNGAFGGSGMVPASVASDAGKVRLLEFPVVGDFDLEEAAPEGIAARTESAVTTLVPPLIRPGRESLSAGRAWTFDGRLKDQKFDPSHMTVEERIVPPGHRVVAVGHYRASENGLERIVLLNDEREVAFERAGRQRKFWRLIGFIGILLGLSFIVGEMLT